MGGKFGVRLGGCLRESLGERLGERFGGRFGEIKIIYLRLLSPNKGLVSLQAPVFSKFTWIF